MSEFRDEIRWIVEKSISRINITSFEFWDKSIGAVINYGNYVCGNKPRRTAKNSRGKRALEKLIEAVEPIDLKGDAVLIPVIAIGLCEMKNGGPMRFDTPSDFSPLSQAALGRDVYLDGLRQGLKMLEELREWVLESGVPRPTKVERAERCTSYFYRHEFGVLACWNKTPAPFRNSSEGWVKSDIFDVWSLFKNNGVKVGAAADQALQLVSAKTGKQPFSDVQSLQLAMNRKRKVI